MYSTDWSMEELEVEDWASEQREIEAMLYREEAERKRCENMSQGSGFSYPGSVCNYDPTDMLGNDDPDEECLKPAPDRQSDGYSSGAPDWQSDEDEADWKCWVESVVMSETPQRYDTRNPESPYASASATCHTFCVTCGLNIEFCVCGHDPLDSTKRVRVI